MTIKEIKEILKDIPDEKTITVRNLHFEPYYCCGIQSIIAKKTLEGDTSFYLTLSASKIDDYNFKKLGKSIECLLSIITDNAENIDKDLINAYNILCDLYYSAIEQQIK